MQIAVFLVAAAAVLAQPLAARPLLQTTPAAIAGINACRAIPGAEARLACFDRAAVELGTAIASRSIVVLSAEQVRDTHRSLFGFNVPRIPLFAGDRDGESKQLDATVAAVKSLGYGKWRLELPDGAIWETTDSASDEVLPRLGSKIRIKSGTLGNFMISVDGARGVSSRRVR